MPYTKKINTETGILGIWELTETSESLSSTFNFSENEKKEYMLIKFEKRKTEYLATRLLLQEILQKKAEIIYLEYGKPTVKNQSFKISISHSANLLAIIISEKEVGIDVELSNRNINKVAHRFMSTQELQDIQNCGDDQTAKILYWCAKESMFKCTNFHGIQFNSQIIIPPFPIETEGSFTGKVVVEKQTENFRLKYFTYQNNMVVYCVEV